MLKVRIFWCNLGKRGHVDNIIRYFYENCADKHIKYFITLDAYINKKMFRVGLESTKKLFMVDDRRIIMQVTLNRYSFRERINCFAFMNNLGTEYNNY